MLRIAVVSAALVALAIPALGQPPVPQTDIVLEAPRPDVEGYDYVDHTAQSIDLARLRGEPVYSSKTMSRIGHVDDVYIDSASGTTYLGLEIGGLFEIGDKEIVITLDEVSVYRRIPVVADPYAPGLARPVGEGEEMPEDPELARIEEERRTYLEKFRYRYESYRLYVDATEEELADFPEFDLY